MGVEWEWISLGRGSRVDFVGELGLVRLVRMGTGWVQQETDEILEALLGHCGNLVQQNLPEI